MSAGIHVPPAGAAVLVAMAAFALGCRGRDQGRSAADTRAVATADRGPATAASCEAGALTDGDYHAPIPVLDAPNGHARFEIRNDAGSGDIWMLVLRDHASGHFRASVSTISDSAREGWIGERYVGVFARNYSRPLTLYTAPDTGSPVQSVVADWWPKLYPVTGCRGRWLRVRATIDGAVKEGWMPPTMQCDNPYTTCN